MTKQQFWVLNVVSALLIVLLFAHFFLARANNKRGAQLNSQRAYIANARQLQPALENLARRIAAAGEKDPKLKALLVKYDIQISSSRDMKTAEGAAATLPATSERVKGDSNPKN